MTQLRRAGVVVAAVIVGVLSAGLPGPASATATSWTQVGAGSLNNISGMAANGPGWVVIRDNKQAGQDRIALLDNAGHATSLAWPGALPTDLESVDAVPGLAGGFAAVTSTGHGSIVQVSGTTVTLLATFALPNAKSGVESFALTAVGSTSLAVWAKRGSTTQPGVVSTATFTWSTGVFGKVTTGKVTVPYPTTSVRQVSDLKVIGGRLVIASTSDPGNLGPFVSALYDIGTVGWSGASATLALTAPASLGQFAGHKVEAIACSGTTGLLGSDDERGGGWIMPFDFCAANVAP